MSTTYGVNWAAIDLAVGRPGHAVHPGEILSEWLEDNDVTQHQLATTLDVTDPFIGMIRAGSKNIGPRTALKLEAATGIRAEVWLHLQMAHDLAKLRGRRWADVEQRRGRP